MKNSHYYQITAWFLLGIITAVAIVLQYAQTITDNDIWFTITYGRYFLEHHTLIPDHGIFSWTPAINSTIYCSWLPSIFFYLLYKAGGLTSLFALRYLCILVFIVLALSFAEKKHITSIPVTLLILLCGAIMSTSGIRIKAEIFSFIFMTIMVWTWFKIKTLSRESDNTGRYFCYVLPVLMLLWVNSHGGFIFGLVFLGIIGLGEIINQIARSTEMLNSKTSMHLFISILLSFIAILFTPYGWEYPGQLLNNLILNPEEARRHFQSILEYQNIFFPAIRHLLYIDSLAIALCILIPLVILNLKRRSPDWTILLSNALFMLLYIKYIRSTYFWGILFVFTALYLLKDVFKSHQDLLSRKPAVYYLQSVIVCILLVFSARVQYQALTTPDLGFRVNYYSPIAEAEFIRKNFPAITRIGNEYNSGSYLMWALWPEKKVFIDSRYFPYVKWYDEYQSFCLTLDPAYKSNFLKKYPCDLWVLTYDSPPLQYFLSSPDWRLIYYGPSACVFLSRRISYPQGHQVSDSIYNTTFYQASFISRFALQIGDYQVTKRLLTHLKPLPFSKFEKKYAVTALLEAGDIMCSNKHFSEAIDLLPSVLKIDPDSDDAYLMLGSAQLNMNRNEDAIISYKELIRLNPGSEAAHNNIADALMRINKLYESAREYSNTLKINPLNVSAQTSLSSVLERIKILNNQIAQMDASLKTQPDNLSLLNSLAEYSAMTGQYENSITYLKQMAALTPDNPEVYYNIACMYSMLNRVDESQAWIERAIKKGFKNWPLLQKDMELENFRKTDFYKDLLKKS